MKPYNRKNNKIRIRNKSKFNSVKDKQHKNNFLVSNPICYFDKISTRLSVIRKRIKKAKNNGITKENIKRYLKFKT